MVKNQATKSNFGGKGVWDYYQVTKKGHSERRISSRQNL